MSLVAQTRRGKRTRWAVVSVAHSVSRLSSACTRVEAHRPGRATPWRWFNWKRHYVNGKPAHSAKPDAFYDLVEAVSDGPYVELFARRARFGWDYWGDESLGTAEVAA